MGGVTSSRTRLPDRGREGSGLLLPPIAGEGGDGGCHSHPPSPRGGGELQHLPQWGCGLQISARDDARKGVHALAVLDDDLTVDDDRVDSRRVPLHLGGVHPLW